ncbi:GRAM domain-containing protein 2B isoform X2 [Drosophila busckii]|uniref:GRAM domain-containing protein 2B isoform X2 n=1 Tax=Drosophila busckii TaxID=30019 RepID=UPI00083EF0AC|nr:GRAM domain-containing protein 2B isoform X2 [Drosophila busckii]
MDYLTPTKAYSRLSSHSASPRRRGRANSLTPPVQDLTEPSAPTPKRPPRPTTPLNELFRPRCNTDPSRQSRSNNNSNNSGNKKPTGTRSVLGSLLRQTFKVTSASVGFSASEERLTQLATTGSLSDNAKRRHSRSASTLANGNTGLTIDATNSMAPLQSPANGAATATATTTAAALNAHQQQQQQQQQQLLQQQQQQLQLRRQHYCQQLSLPESFAGEDNNSLPQSYSTSINPAQPNAGAGSGSAQSLVSSASPSPSPSSSNSNSQGRSKSSSHNNSNNNNGKGLNTAKQHEQQSGGTMAGNSNSVAAVAAGNGTPPEKDKDKEKKRKEVSSSRVKKFHRHFSQVSKDEKLINYFSCALVGDIPLQGHLYITDQHFAFYSNVFGYVTKVVIPTSSVTKISKEKTAKIIPNAVGVSTADERHVFNSFISREAAFRLMCTVCVQLANGIESLPKPLPLDDVELTEEYLMDDDSSCSISGNESPPQRALGASAEPEDDGKPQAMLRQRIRHSDPNKSLLGAEAHGSLSTRSSAPPVVHYETPVASSLQGNSRSASATASAASSGTPSTSSSPTTVMGVADNSPPTPTRGPQGSKLSRLAHSVRSRLSLPTLTELHVLYLGILLAILLALFSVFLLYRILDIEAKTSLYNTPVDFNARLGSDEDIFAEALRWQKELQDKSHAETQHILSKNLEQITKVRRSLETLSMLINDRRTGYAAAQAAAAASPSLAAAANHISGNRDDSSD